jgi:outer membrane protein assembly factor BamB
MLVEVLVIFTFYFLAKAAAALAAPSTTALQYSAPWPGPRRNQYGLNQSPFNSSFSVTKKLQAYFPTANSIKGSPIIDADGIIYVGSTDGHLYALVMNEGVLLLRWYYK